ncbi:MAG TPA: phosphoribosylglycinamide formyltransferase [Caulobacteraceae bacterium]|nr:phosphoribosylglycinamide formyltransferase [Caulobacteraceae bacterium]
MDRVRVAVLISGRGSNMGALIEASRAPDSPYEVAVVVASREDAEGLERARGFGVEAVAVASRPFAGDREAHERAVDAALRARNIDLIALAGWMRLLTPWFVRVWEGRMLNIHPSLLPKHPGLNTHARALEAGDATAGCTVHLVTEGMDEGPILAQAEVPVLAGDTPDVLAARVLEAEHRIYPQALAAVAERLRG